MKNIFITSAMSLLVLFLCSCGGGGNAVDCSGSTGTVPTSAGKSVGAAVLSVFPYGELSYSIQGSGIDGVAGIQIDIAYDPASLATPTVTQGALVAGAMFASNTATPGRIKIAIITTGSFSGSGEIASVTFASRTGTGGITSITTSTFNSQGTQYPDAGTLPPPDVPPGQTPPQTSTSSTACR